jgi:hypothetical protein
LDGVGQAATDLGGGFAFVKHCNGNGPVMQITFKSATAAAAAAVIISSSSRKEGSNSTRQVAKTLWDFGSGTGRNF